MTHARGCRAVFFDAGGTLLHPYPSVGEIYREVAARYGRFSATAQELEALFRATWVQRDGIAALASHSSEKIEREWWRTLVHEVFSRVGGVEDFEAFFDELYELFGRPEVWRLYPEVPEVLQALRSRGIKLGVVSNWDSRLFRLCEGFALSPYFDFVLASAVFGASKPSRRIFDEALRLAGIPPADALHVGDSLEDDVRGAEAAGVRAVLIDRNGHGHAPPGVATIADLKELL